MSKYFDGKRFNYIKTGDKNISKYAIKKITMDNNNNWRHPIYTVTNLLNVRRRNAINKNSSTTKVKKRMLKKKETKWQKLVNGVNPLYTRLSTALKNLGKKLYAFLDEV